MHPNTLHLSTVLTYVTSTVYSQEKCGGLGREGTLRKERENRTKSMTKDKWLD